MSVRSWLSISSAVGLVLAPRIALAQVAGQPAEPRSPTVGEVVVTADKRAERVIDTPMSVTAVSASDLERLGAAQFRDFAASVPALSFTSAGVGQTQVSLRGVTTGNDIGPTVAIYVDDVPYGSSSAFANSSSLALDVGLFDLDHIEVLRGPQGTLYGAGAMGGLIKYVTVAPDLTHFGGAAQAGVSATQDGGVGYNGALALNAPLVADKVALRADGFYSRDGGFIDNVTLGQRDVDRSAVYGGRAELLIQPVQPLTIRITGFLQDIHRDGEEAADYTLAGQPVSGSLDQSRLVSEPFDERFRLVSGAVAYDFGPATLTSVSSYQTLAVSFRQDASAVYVGVLQGFGLDFHSVAIDQGRSTDKFTQELRLGSDGQHTVDWLVGGYYTQETSGNTEQSEQTDLAGAPSPVNLVTLAIPSTYQEEAAYGDLTWHVSSKFDVTGGLRYAHNHQTFAQNGSGLLIGSVPAATSDGDVVTYLADARYHLDDRSTVYFRYATGYRPGGPNFVVRDPVTGALLAPATFQSDNLASYELGYKAQTRDRRFDVDVAAYHIDWNNIQITTAAGGVSVIANAGGATVDGAELTLGARPWEGISATGAFAFQYARLADASADLGAAKGEALPNTPRFTANLSLDYRLPEGLAVRPTLGASFRYVGARTASFDGNAGLPQYHLPAYASVDLRAGLPIGPVQAELYVRNLFDVRGQLSAATVLSSTGGPAQVTMLQPRTVGISTSARF